VVKPLLILGARGNCVDILEAVTQINQTHDEPIYDVVGFLDDNPATHGTSIGGSRVLGALASAGQYDDCVFVNGIGSPDNYWRKREIIASTQIELNRFETIVHPTASVSGSAFLGPGSVVLQHVTVASHVRIEEHVIILPNSVLSHNDLVGPYTCIAGSVCISGEVEVGQSCYLGANSSIIGNIRIGEYSLVGIGSVVLNDVPNSTVVAGNPARRIRSARAVFP
jgi:sugar O-acyltransferase (sialic acid O-acetyltransferase NeuD family)